MRENGKNESAVSFAESNEVDNNTDIACIQFDVTILDSSPALNGKTKPSPLPSETLSVACVKLGALSSDEFRKLQAIELKIKQGWDNYLEINQDLAKVREEYSQREWNAFLQVAEALTTIRDEHLYRQNYSSFEQYCRDKWHYSKAHAYHLIAAAETVKCLSSVEDKLPKNERQVRLLNGLSKELKQLVWERTIVLAGDEKITSKHVKAAVAELVPAQKNGKKRPNRSVTMEKVSEDDWQKAHALIKNALCFVDKQPENAASLLKSLAEHLRKMEKAREGTSPSVGSAT